MDNLKITKQELLDILAQAFDKGWSGYLDLKETVILGIVDNFIINHPPEPLPPASVSYCSYPSSTSPSNSVLSSFASGTYLTGVDWGAEVDAPSTYPARRLTGVDWRAEYQQEVPPFPSPGVEVARADWSNISGTFAGLA
jgi:hypothetical protein